MTSRTFVGTVGELETLLGGASTPEPKPEIVLDERQEEAATLVCEEPIGIITGGPGTGKSTTMRVGLQRLREKAQAKGRRAPVIALTAPTGKAARRLEETTGEMAGTVHRLLGWRPGEGWGFNAAEPLPFDAVIVDESSMLDTELAAALFAACDPRRTSLIFLGDVNQLPSVGPGRVLGDLIDTGRVPTVRLETVHRQAQKSWVYRNAPKVLEGTMPDLGETEDFQFVEVDQPQDLAEVLVGLFEDELNRVATQMDGSAEDAFDAVQILSPQRVGPIGTGVLNKRIQAAVQGGAAHSGGWDVHDDLIIHTEDKVIQTKNNYDLGLMNGETGIVQGIQNRNRLVVRVAGTDYGYDKSSARALELGYAITVHKSQGSEYATCIVVCHSAHARMLSRQLFYTAITRAKGRLVVVGNREGLTRAVENARVAERQTGLQERILGDA